ncbi:MAG: HAMP domain-containing histidine kinase [Bacteroidaceae bacterium]|nr:HAMP domain-containing histidine kinase [Bacteroidaceae bacterium]
MKKSTIWFLAITMVITFVGLLFTQFVYMENMIKMRNEQFTEAVRRSLSDVSRELEREETQKYLQEGLELDIVSGDNDVVGEIFLQPQLSIKSPDGAIKVYPFDELKKYTKSLKQPSGSPSTLTRPSQLSASILDVYRNMEDMLHFQYEYQRKLIDRVIINILGEAASRPILERVDTLRLKEYVKVALENNGLNLPFELAVIDNKGKVVYHSQDYNPAIANNLLFSQIIFSNDPPGRRNTLRVYFPTKNDYLFDSVRFIIPSFIFTFIMLVTFTFTLIIVFRQKKLTDMKNDFINNMTHEFKTPISTISLAAQMLNDSAMTKSPQMMQHISGVINDETRRLRLQVEKVLQMSMFDRQKAQLKLHEVDVNDLIAGVMSTFKIKVEKFGGSIDADLAAEDMVIAADDMHFTNVIFNLLDNAVKYRREDVPLSLFISTRIIADDKVEISIRDNGIGIKKDDLKKIFDKFYRVSTGNRHDVKGFGLGLAYVHKIIKDHNGDIRAESELNEGSTFIITLPLIKK